MNTQISTINFHNQSLITFEQNGTHYTAMKPICENIGLEWHAQRQRIQRDEVLSQGAVIITLPSNGGNQQMICLPIEYLNGWLFGIDVKRVKPEIREKLITYKKECYQALFNYWNKQQPQQLALPAPEQTTLTPEEQRQVQNAVQATHNRTKLSYGEIWARVKNKFKVAKYEQIARTQIRDVLIYIASMSSTQDVVNGIVLSVEEFYALAKAIDYVNRSTYEWEQLTELFEMMESYKYCRNAHNLGIASNNIASTSERIIMRHAAQITDKHIREEIEKQFYSNPHVRSSTQLKVSNGLR